ncbi:class I SAM-dependent methyltransferase [Streptomyces mobaraensis]|uniref:class I SAM-dependent methyltransferase n=1 Tax=Streptomyces mobaraensis TaxID=35621 RepID=UPI0033327966
MIPMNADRQVWADFGRFHLVPSSPPGFDHVDLTFWGAESGDEVLSSLTDRRALDIGTGTGRHAVRLDRVYGALVDAVDGSSQGKPDAGCNPADLLDHVRQEEDPYDVVYTQHVRRCVDSHSYGYSPKRAHRRLRTRCPGVIG